MRPLTILLEENQIEAIEAIARENGADDAAAFVHSQLLQFLADYRRRKGADGFRIALTDSINENLGLLRRLGANLQ